MNKHLRRLSALLPLFVFPAAFSLGAVEPVLTLSPQGYLETPGLNVLAFSNFYDGAFSATPGQWHPVPMMVSRTVDAAARRIGTEFCFCRSSTRIRCTALEPKQAAADSWKVASGLAEFHKKSQP